MSRLANCAATNKNSKMLLVVEIFVSKGQNTRNLLFVGLVTSSLLARLEALIHIIVVALEHYQQFSRLVIHSPALTLSQWKQRTPTVIPMKERVSWPLISHLLSLVTHWPLFYPLLATGRPCPLFSCVIAISAVTVSSYSTFLFWLDSEAMSSCQNEAKLVENSENEKEMGVLCSKTDRDGWMNWKGKSWKDILFPINMWVDCWKMQNIEMNAKNFNGTKKRKKAVNQGLSAPRSWTMPHGHFAVQHNNSRQGHAIGRWPFGSRNE